MDMAHPCERVLVVEDDDEVRESMVDYLVMEDIEAVSAATGDEALATLRRGPRPDVILLDLSLPGMSGTDLLQRLKEEPAWATIPVAVMSGYPRGRFGYVPPASEYLEKPFDLDRLNEAISRLCGEAQRAGTVSPCG